MPRLAVLGHPVAHSRSPAMQNAALAALGLGEEWSYEAIDVAPEDFEARVRAMAARRLRRRQRHRPPQGGGAGAGRRAERGGARDRRRQHAESSPTGRIQADNTDADGLLAALPELASGPAGAGAGRRRRRPGGGLGAGARGGGGRGLEPDRRARRRLPGSRSRSRRSCGPEREWAPVERAAPRRSSLDQRGYELIVNTTAVGLARRGPLRSSCRCAADRFAAGQIVVDMVYGDAPSPLLAAAAAAGADDRRRPRDPRPAGRPLAADLDRPRAAARRDARRRPRLDSRDGR